MSQTLDATSLVAGLPVLFAGSPQIQVSLYHRCQFMCGDASAHLTLPSGKRIFIVRDIEKPRAKKQAAADVVYGPPELAPAGGLSGDRDTGTAQATAELLVREGIDKVAVDRSLPYLFAVECQKRGIELVYGPDLGVLDRRVKTEQELAWIAEAQAVTEQGIELACRMVAKAERGAGGVLVLDGAPLSPKRVKQAVTQHFLSVGYSQPHGLIVAGVPDCADCHGSGEADLMADQPVIVDIFPICDQSRYHGDCTRTVVNGTPSDVFRKMHQAVVDAKHAAEKACVVGATGESVHLATVKVLEEAGFAAPRVAPDGLPDTPTMPHGTGHGLGLAVHEPILLAYDVQDVILENEVFTIEPGLYATGIGGVRVEDAVVTQKSGPRNLNTLHEGLDWR